MHRSFSSAFACCLFVWVLPVRSRRLRMMLRSGALPYKAYAGLLSIRVFAASGYFDLATPFCANGVKPAHARAVSGCGEADHECAVRGCHAAYMTPAVRVQFAKDAEAFVTGQVP